MLKVYVFEFNDTFLTDINWKSRIEYKKWDKVIVASRDDVMSLYSLWCTLVLEKEIKAEDILEKEIKAKK